MSQILLKGQPINTIGKLPDIGSKAPDFTLTANDLKDISLKDFDNKTLILNIFPSIDTAVCATSVRKFNTQAQALPNTKVLCISADLPFAHARFCAGEGLDNVITLSDFRNKDFGINYGVKIIDSTLSGLLSRAIVIIDKTGKIIYTEQVSDIANEPDYEKVLNALK